MADNIDKVVDSLVEKYEPMIQWVQSGPGMWTGYGGGFEFTIDNDIVVDEITGEDEVTWTAQALDQSVTEGSPALVWEGQFLTLTEAQEACYEYVKTKSLPRGHGPTPEDFE